MQTFWFSLSLKISVVLSFTHIKVLAWRNSNLISKSFVLGIFWVINLCPLLQWRTDTSNLFLIMPYFPIRKGGLTCEGWYVNQWKLLQWWKSYRFSFFRNLGNIWEVVPSIRGGRICSLSAVGGCFGRVLGGWVAVLHLVLRPETAAHTLSGETHFNFWVEANCCLKTTRKPINKYNKSKTN